MSTISVGPRHTRRRSSRVKVEIPVLLATLETANQCSEVCEALVVNVHGCAMRSPKPVEAGVAVRLQTRGGRQTRARVVACQLIIPANQGWMLGVSLDEPGNFWSLMPCPEDWLRASDQHADNQSANLVQPLAALVSNEAEDSRMRLSSLRRSEMAGPNAGCRVETQINAKTGAATLPAQGLASSRNTVAEKHQPAGRYDLFPQGREQLSAIVAELIQPLQTEVRTLREKTEETEQKRSEVDVARAHIPSDVEERLLSRVRQYVEAEIARQTAPLQARFAEIVRQPETVRPLGEQELNSLRDLSTRIEAVDADLRSLVGEQTKTAQQWAGELANKIESVTQIAGQTSKQLANVPHVLRAQITHQQDQLSTVTREYAAEIERLKQFRVATDAALQQMAQQRTGISTLSDEVSQIVEKQFAAFRRDVERQIREQSEETLTAAKGFFDDQGAKGLEMTRAAATVLQEIEATGEALKARLQKTTTDAQQHTFTVFEHHISCAHDEVRKWVSDELQAFDHRAQILFEGIAGRMRQELGEAVIQDREGLRAWLEQQGEDIRKAVQGAAFEASAEIKARLHMNLEMATNSGQDIQQEMVRQLQERAGRAAKEFEEQVAESISSFETQMDELVQESITRCRLAVVQDLKAIAITLDMQGRAKP